MKLEVDKIINHDVTKPFPLPDNCIDVVITSPPYWGLRNYGKNTDCIFGGDPECTHDFSENVMLKRPRSGNIKLAKVGATKSGVQNIRREKSSYCSKCGAWKGQLGLEPHPQMFIDHIVYICSEIKRVLKKSGSFYLNLGDTYYGSGGAGGDYNKGGMKEGQPRYKQGSSSRSPWLQPKQLLGMPWRSVIALQNNGWVLRNCIIWHKPNPLPSPFKDRLSNTYEFVFHLVQSKKYYYNLDAIRIPNKAASLIRSEYGFKQLPRAWEQDATPIPGGKTPNFKFHEGGRNPGDVTEYEGKSKGKNDQFQKLCDRKNYERQVLGIPHDLATCHPNGKNPSDVDVTNWKEMDANKEDVPRVSTLWKSADTPRTTHPLGRGPGDFWDITTQAFTAYNPDMEHFACFPERLVVNPLKSSCPPGGIVLDPFCGRGTVGKVAKSLGMHYILFDIKPEYCELARLFIGGQKHKIDKNQKELGEFKNDI